MNKTNIITIVLLCGVLCISAYDHFFVKDVVYVDIGKLVDTYKLKKDLEKKEEGNLILIKNVIDSLKFVNKISHSLSIDSNIRRLEYEFSQYYERSNQQITTELWNRLNPAIDEFGKRNSYKIIIGANGAGNVLYGEKKYDVTNDLITFVNNLYEKGK